MKTSFDGASHSLPSYSVLVVMAHARIRLSRSGCMPSYLMSARRDEPRIRLTKDDFPAGLVVLAETDTTLQAALWSRGFDH